MSRAAWCVVLLCILGVGARAGAQTPAPAPAAAPALTVTGSVRGRAELWDWFGGGDAGEYGFVGTTLRLAVAGQRPGFGWHLEGSAPLLAGLPEDAVEPAPRGQLGAGASYRAASDGADVAAGVFLKQAFLRLGAAPGARGQMLRLGRFELVDGAEVAPADPTLAALKRDRVAHRLLGNFGWSHVGRSFDGAHYALTRPGLNLTAAALRPTQGVFDVDGWPDLEVGVAYGALTLPRPSAPHPGEARLFALYYRDYRDAASVVKVDNRAAAARQADREDVSVTTLGGHYLRALATPAGTVDVLLWGAVQAGGWGTLDHRAGAAAVEAGFQPRVLPALRPWLRAGWSLGTGDDDPADGRHATFFQLLPTPRIYARFPFYNQMNVQDLFASLALRAGPRLTVRGDVRSLRLAEARDLWYSGGGAFERESFGYAGRPSGGGRSLATLVDLSADFRLTPRLTTSLYLARAAGGDVVESIYAGGETGTLGYLELEYRR